MTVQTTENIIEVRDLKKHFPVTKGIIMPKTLGYVRAVDGVSFSIRPGETFALVGESGCGKTTTAKLLLHLEKPTSGDILYRGKEYRRFTSTDLRQQRREVQTVFQNPWSSLDPRMRVKTIVAEPLALNNVSSLSKKEIERTVVESLDTVGLSSQDTGKFPHEFSGGQRQRIAIARALVTSPSLLVLDEPVSALDVSIGAQIMNLLRDIQETQGIAYFLISHHLATVAYLSDWVGVMYLGQLVEIARTEELFDNPCHPYTKALLSAALPVHPRDLHTDIVLEGEVPSPMNPPSGCRFHTRCPQVMTVCPQQETTYREVVPDHFVACHLF